MINRWKVFQKSYNNSIESIQYYLENANEEYPEALECKHLINWLFKTEHNPYGIFKEDWHGSSMGCAEGFAGLAAEIHHAICDDGDICYPVVNGRPFIDFWWQHEEGIEKRLIKEDEFTVKFMKNIGHYEPPTLTFLKNAYEFTKAFDEYEEQQLCYYAELENRRWEKEHVK